MSEPFIAEVRMFACNFAPRGWAFCNGQLLPISQNTALFSLVGTTYGGDGRTTFGLPNLQGRAPMHPGRGPGLTIRDLGESGGSDGVTLTASEMPLHSHSIERQYADGPANSRRPRRRAIAAQQGEPLFAAATGTESTGTSGSGQSHENRQPYIAVNVCIAITGLYPSRS